MTNLMGNSTFTVKSDASISVHDDGLVILDLRSGRVFTSNPTGVRIWRCIERELPLNAIADEVSGEYRIDRATAYRDVAGFLNELERNQLIEPVSRQ
jgi:hypothetical protein